MNELMIPRSPEVAERLHGFYEEIGWEVRDKSNSVFDTYVAPQLPEGYARPTIAYWQTESPRKNARFSHNRTPAPSHYAVGLRMPKLEDMVEIILLVPTDDMVHDIFREGGKLLTAHAYIPPHEHAGRQEFRFSDPFNYALRVTADPGYEVNPVRIDS